MNVGAQRFAAPESKRLAVNGIDRNAADSPAGTTARAQMLLVRKLAVNQCQRWSCR
jgi:hypothetical protein